jgi:hypothetical protein
MAIRYTKINGSKKVWMARVAKLGRERARGGDTDGDMRLIHDYKGWRVGLTALEQDGTVDRAHRGVPTRNPSREQSPMPLSFGAKASSDERILVLAQKHAEDWIDRQESPTKGGA